jgi:TRAP-type C4-dicarboxylate transport system permease large subunit
VLLAVPLFILAADLMNSGSLTDRLLRFCLLLVGRFRGGLGHVNVVSNIIFAGMSGSAIADAVGIGRIIIGMMTRGGRYPVDYAAAITASAAIIGPIIPPSIPMVVYALISDTSIGYLFLGGVIPGLVARRRVHDHECDHREASQLPGRASVPLRDVPRVTLEAFPGAVASGRAAVRHLRRRDDADRRRGCCRRLCAACRPLLYRALSFRQLHAVLLSSVKATTGVGMLIAGALAFNYVVTIENVPLTVQRFMSGFELSRYRLSSAGQRRASGARLPARRHDHPARHRADHDSHRQGARHRPRATSAWSPSSTS